MSYIPDPPYTFLLRVAPDYEGKKFIEPDRYQFTFTSEQMNETVQAQWNETSVMGRSEPWQTYNSTGPRQIPLDFELQATEDPQKDVVDPGRWLQASQFPVYTDTRIYRPPIFLFFWGNLFNVRCRVDQATITWKGPWTDGGMLPHRADVSLSLKAVSSRAPSWSSIAKGLPNG